MKCPHADYCPSKSGWCTKPNESCVEFILTAYENLQTKHSKLLHDIELLYYRLARMRDNDSQ